jgi:branched-chain amino acid transport system permease protein
MSPTSILTKLQDNFTDLRQRSLYIGVIIAGIVLILPIILEPYLTTIVISFLFGVIIAASWNIMAITGFVNFGHAMFIGLGAFTAGLSTLWLDLGTSVGWGLVLVVILGGLISMGFALLLGYPLLRLRGYCSIENAVRRRDRRS